MKRLLPTLLFLCLASSAQLDAQAASIPVIDMRGHETKDAIVQAVENTKQTAIIVLIIGGDDTLFDAVLAKMKGLYHEGYTRIGIIRAASGAEGAKPGIGVFADGTIYASIKDAKPSTYHAWSLTKLIRDGYSEHVTPHLNKEGQ